MFKGEREDLRRFVTKITEKIQVNSDRYPTPATRIAYVNSYLSSLLYKLILPYIRDGIYTLSDYPAVL